MARKVFLSFLGNGFYDESLYYDEEIGQGKAVSTRFVQVATLNYYAKNFSNEDKILIFTTDGALLNWNDNTHIDRKNDDNEVFYKGLENCINQLNLKVKPKNIPIPSGNSTRQIWDIFKIVFNEIKANDQLIFDITHGFRSLPMLNMVLINYAKLLRHVSISGVHYGAYEAKVRSKDGKEYSPIWDLTDFVSLQDWTNAANIFLHSGNGMELAKQIKANENEKLKEGLVDLSKSILVNRGMEIVEGENIISLREELQRLENTELPPQETPLKQILEKIRNKFDEYEKNNPINGFLAAKWAINNSLIQQGATLLEEAVTTFILFDIGQEKLINNKDIRLSTSSAISIGTEKTFDFIKIEPKQEDTTDKEDKDRLYKLEIRRWQEEFVPVIRKLAYKKKLGHIISSIKNSVRNDINHAGFRGNPRSYDAFETSLKKRYKELQKLFKKINKFELPDLKK